LCDLFGLPDKRNYQGDRFPDSSLSGIGRMAAIPQNAFDQKTLFGVLEILFIVVCCIFFNPKTSPPSSEKPFEASIILHSYRSLGSVGFMNRSPSV